MDKNLNFFDRIFKASYRADLAKGIEEHELRELAKRRIDELTSGMDGELPATELLKELDGRLLNYMELHEDRNTALTFAKDFAMDATGNCAVRMGTMVAALERLGREDIMEKLGVKLNSIHVWLAYHDACNNASSEIGASGHASDKKYSLEALIAATLANTGFNMDYHARNPAEAVKCYDEALELNPNDPGIWNCKGVALKNLKDPLEAIKCYNNAIELEPDYSDAWSNKGVAFDELGEFAKAVECYDVVLESEPDNWVVWNNKGDALRGLAKQQGDSNKHEKAIESYARSLELNPGSPVGWKSMGDVLCDLGKLEGALDCYDNAITLNPQYHGAWQKKGDALNDMGLQEEAAKCYDVAGTLETPAGVNETS